MKHIAREIKKLNEKFQNLGAITEESFSKAIYSLDEMDVELAREIIAKDKLIDTIEIEVEEDCLKILALYQPVAKDLRYIVSILKINNDIERIGDLTANICERVIRLANSPEPVSSTFVIPLMSASVKLMLKKSLLSLVEKDDDLAHEVCGLDDEVDTLHSQMYRLVKEEVTISGLPNNLDNLMNLIAISRFLERIADHTTNIAEDVIYMMDGEIVRHKG